MREMKDSGVEWIGEIPSDWGVTKTKYVAEIFTGNSISDYEKDNYTDSNDAIPYIATKDIRQNYNTINYENGLYIKKDDHSFVRANQESSLMCIEGGSAGRKKAYVEREICFVNKLCCFAPKDYYGKYLYYILNSPNYEAQFNLNISGLIGGVSKSVLKEFVIPKPDYEVQKRIADFLDKKCSKIDKIISKQEQIIEKLKAYKLSIITEVVSRGLKSNVKQYDSGNEFIGMIPEGWQCLKVKNVASLVTDGAHISPDTENGVFDFVSTVNLEQDFIHYDESLKTSQESYEYLVKAGCKPLKDDVLISKDGSVGRTSVVREDRDFVVSSSLVIIRPRQNMILPEFLNYNLQAKYVQDTLLMLMHGAGLKRVSVRKNSSLPVVLPPLSEQKDIVRFLNNKCRKINDTLFRKQRLLELLREYKKSLIYEVVTGKKEIIVHGRES